MAIIQGGRADVMPISAVLLAFITGLADFQKICVLELA
jgi:hypothetical protein